MFNGEWRDVLKVNPNKILLAEINTSDVYTNFTVPDITQYTTLTMIVYTGGVMVVEKSISVLEFISAKELHANTSSGTGAAAKYVSNTVLNCASSPNYIGYFYAE